MAGPSCPCIVFGIFTVIGVIILISVGNTVVKEYNLAKDFKPTQCTLLDMTELGFRTCEYCYTTSTSTRRGGHRTRRSKTKCRTSSFPCVRMVVGFYDRYGTNRTATFFPDAVKFTKSIMCSFYACGSSVINNEMEVMQQVRSYQLSHKAPFPCYYSNEHRDRVIGRKIHTYNEAFHGMLWPGLLTGICAAGALITFCGLHERFMGKKEEPMKSLLDTSSTSDSHNYGGVGPDAGAIPEKTPLAGPVGLPPGAPPPFDLTNPQPCPTQPYYPGGPPVYPPTATKDFPNPEGGAAYPPPQHHQYPNQGPAYPPAQGPAYPPPAQPYANQGPAYPPPSQPYANQGPACPPSAQPYPNQGPGYPPSTQPYPNQAPMYPPLDQSQTTPSSPPPNYDSINR